jgi:hypothetical protein
VIVTERSASRGSWAGRAVARGLASPVATALAIVLALGGAGVGSAACGPPGAARTVSMRMVGGPPNASVTIDDQFVGTLDVVAARGVALPPGVHRVTVEAPGFLPWDKAIDAKDGDAVVRLEVRLLPIPD